MTKTAFIVSLMALAAAGQATASGMPASGAQPQGASDPCLLGNAADPAACAGMIRVAPGMTVQSQSYSSSAAQNAGPTVLFDPNRVYQAAPTQQGQAVQMQAMAPSAPRQQNVTVTSTYNRNASQSSSTSQSGAATYSASAGHSASPPMPMNCVSTQAGATVTCHGYWVPAHQTQTVQPPVATGHPPVEPQFQPPPPQVVILQPPVAPSPIMLPPPTTLPMPCCQQEQREVTLIPASFFMGGMSYGVGFPIETSYSYGGGGFAFVGGGTRFSGVRDRVHMDPPPRKPRKPPHKPCGCH